MARRRPPEDKHRPGEPAPPHIRQLLAGLIHFNGDAAAHQAARYEWCQTRGCYRYDGRKSCADVFGRPCYEFGQPRTGTVRVGPGALAGSEEYDDGEA